MNFLISPICLGDISSGLIANDRDWFELNGKKFRIFSGSLHYFRVHPDYWRDRLKKYRAAGQFSEAQPISSNPY